MTGGHEVEADVDQLDVGHPQPVRLQHRRQERLLAGDPGVGHRLAAEVGRPHDPRRLQDHDPQQRLLHQRRHRDDRHPRPRGQQTVGLVGDAEGVAPGADRLQDGRRVGRGVGVDRSPSSANQPRSRAQVEPGVVGVRVPVQRHVTGVSGRGSWRRQNGRRGARRRRWRRSPRRRSGGGSRAQAGGMGTLAASWVAGADAVRPGNDDIAPPGGRCEPESEANRSPRGHYPVRVRRSGAVSAPLSARLPELPCRRSSVGARQPTPRSGRRQAGRARRPNAPSAAHPSGGRGGWKRGWRRTGAARGQLGPRGPLLAGRWTRRPAPATS
jgi:hypothetical protein